MKNRRVVRQKEQAVPFRQLAHVVQDLAVPGAVAHGRMRYVIGLDPGVRLAIEPAVMGVVA